MLDSYHQVIIVKFKYLYREITTRSFPRKLLQRITIKNYYIKLALIIFHCDIYIRKYHQRITIKITGADC
jgi:hypothetical protein